MFFSLKKKDKFSYIEEGEGQPIVLLHGLMGELSNFSSLTNYYAQRGYKVFAPELPLYSRQPTSGALQVTPSSGMA